MEFPIQRATDRRATAPGGTDLYDMRDHLTPRRLTLAMWDQAFVHRHGPGGSFADFDRVLDETVERGYNTVRLDPMPQMWGWTPHNYVQPQFRNWQDAKWHQKLTQRFLQS